MRLLLVVAVLVVVTPGASAAAGKSAPAAPPVVEGTVRSYADKTPIAYRAEGQGLPALVFIHGWSGDSSIWKSQVEAFVGQRRVVTLDLAGHGRSGADRKAWTVRSFAADVKTVVEELHLRKVVLVGHSMGGAVALEAARIMPERVVAVVGVDTLQDAERTISPDQREAFLAPLRTDFAQGAAAFVKGMFPPDADPRLVEDIAARAAAAPAGPAIAMLEQLFAYDVAAGFAGVRAPIRCLNSDRYPTNVAGNRKYAKDFDVVILAGVGHVPQLEKPGEFNDALTKVLAAVAPREGR